MCANSIERRRFLGKDGGFVTLNEVTLLRHYKQIYQLMEQYKRVKRERKRKRETLNKR